MSYAKSYLTSSVTSYLTRYVVSDVKRLVTSFFYEVLKIGLENAALGLQPRTPISRPWSQSFSIRTNP